jgi:cytochrome P450
VIDDRARARRTEFDHRDHESHVNPCPRWKAMREAGPVLHTDAHGGFYVIPRYAEVVEAARDTAVFSSSDKTTIPPMATPPTPPIHADPPEARRWREILNPYFSPTKIAEYQPWIRELVAEVVDPLLQGSSFDVPRDIGIPLTRQVILRIMGIADAPTELNEWTDEAVFGLDERAEHGGAMIVEYLAAEIRRRRASPDAGLITEMFSRTLKPDNRLLTDAEILKLMLLVLMAALETTSSALSAAVAYLIEHPDDIARLQSRPDIWHLAVEEFVRWGSPAVGLARTARSDSLIGGCPIRAGSRVMLLYASANRDENEFPHADEVVLDRTPNRHVGFGMGPHRCLGSHLAKTQMRLALQRLLPALDEWRIEDESKLIWNAAVTRGLSSAPLVRK